MLLYYDEEALNEDLDEFFEATIEDIAPIPVPAPVTATETNVLTEDEAKKMKVADLKEALKKQGRQQEGQRLCCWSVCLIALEQISL